MKKRIPNTILPGFTVLVLAVTILPSLQVRGQSAEQLASYLERHPEADTNQDGVLTREEARRHRRKDPSRGDNLSSESEIPAIEISLSEAPLNVVQLNSPDGVNLDFAWRKPRGDDPSPAIIFFHGGGGQSSLDGLKKNLLNGAVQTRFLEKGYITVQSTRRPYWIQRGEGGATGFDDAVEDAVLVVEKVKTLPGVDPRKIILYGGSGGGILAVVTASRTQVAGVVAGEPATVVALDPRTGQSAGPAEYRGLMEDPQSLYKGRRKAEMIDWMKRIDCPVLILQGNRTGLYETNFEILVPELEKLGKDISFIEFPGLSHGFYWGTRKTGATLDTVEKIVREVDQFIKKKTNMPG